MKFKNRYVLGEGYPWAVGLEPYLNVSLKRFSVSGLFIPLKFPKELWDYKIPKYRLVLEKIK